MRKRLFGLAPLGLGLAMLTGQAVSAGAVSNSAPDPSVGLAQSIGDHAARILGQADNEATVPAGTLDDGADLLPQAGISLTDAIAAAQAAVPGATASDIGEVDLEDYNGTLVFNVDVGDHDVKVDAGTGAVLSSDLDD